MRKVKSVTASLLVIIAIFVSSLPIVSAAQTAAQPLSYSKKSNSGTRHVVCTTLDGTSADDYYTGSYTYEVLSLLAGNELKKQLSTLMTQTHKKFSSYNDCRDMATKTDCENENGKINLIYSSVSVSYSAYDGGKGWNREHVWPKSLGGFGTSEAGADLHHIRPSDSAINSARGNKLYANVTNGGEVKGGSAVNSALGGWRAGNYFEPLDNVKGDVARICLYVYVTYGISGTSDPYFSNCSNITKVFSDIDTLLEWCELDPVDTWEMGRNEVVADYQGNRNVFIDYPEYAWLIFGREVPEDLVSPTSGERKNNTENPPIIDTDPPIDDIDPPIDDINPPIDDIDPPIDDIDPPIDDTDPPIDDITPPENCAHPSMSRVNEILPTCTSEGYSGDICCDECGKVILSGESVPMTDHNFEKTGKNEDGEEEETCTECGFVRTVPKKSFFDKIIEFFVSLWKKILSIFE